MGEVGQFEIKENAMFVRVYFKKEQFGNEQESHDYEDVKSIRVQRNSTILNRRSSPIPVEVKNDEYFIDLVILER
jgi:hypothetical protein